MFKRKERTIEDVKEELDIFDTPTEPKQEHDRAVAFLEPKAEADESKPTPQPEEVKEPPEEEEVVDFVPLPPHVKKKKKKWGHKEEEIEDLRAVKPMVTRLCPESVPTEGLFDVVEHPEYYIEINIVKKNRVVESFYVNSEIKKFTFKEKEYKIKEDNIFLLPTKTNAMMPTSYYREDEQEPKGFRQLNKGITGKALSLLYMEQLYTSLLYSEDLKYNFFIVILSIATLICFGIGLYMLFFMFPQASSDGGGVLPSVSLIRLWWWK